MSTATIDPVSHHSDNTPDPGDTVRSSKRPRMGSLRKTALAAGVLYLITFVSIPILFLYSEVKDPNYLVGVGAVTPVLVGGVLEVIVALAGVGTAVVLYPVIKRQHQGLALGFVGTRTLEGAGIIAGVVALMTVVSLRQAGAGAAGLVTAQALVAMYGWAFLLSGSLMPALNALLLGSLLYRSRLVPRALPTLGLIGAPLLLASVFAIMFGIIDRTSPAALFLAIPIAVWEFSLGVYLIVKGFKPSPITAGITTAGAQPTAV
jgi:Domain of unknown function (DUF4386)